MRLNRYQSRLEAGQGSDPLYANAVVSQQQGRMGNMHDYRETLLHDMPVEASENLIWFIRNSYNQYGEITIMLVNPFE